MVFDQENNKFEIIINLTHWGRVMHICVDNLTIIGSDNGLSPGRRQAIIWTNFGILLIEPLGTNSSEILIEIITFSVKEMHLKMSGNWWPFCLGLNELTLTKICIFFRMVPADYIALLCAGASASNGMPKFGSKHNLIFLCCSYKCNISVWK